MGGLLTATVDVRDMLCAQALAVVARTMDRLPAASAHLKVVFNTEDVKRDLAVWARERGYAVVDDDPTTLRIERNLS